MWWRHIQPRLALLYSLVALVLIAISVTGHVRLMSQIGDTFGGFFWAIDTDGQVVVVSTPPQLPSFGISAGSVTSVDHIVRVQLKDNHGKMLSFNGNDALTRAYGIAQPGEMITYAIRHSNNQVEYV